jgi:pyridoxamine 5'-phosphate oxidase-like protein
LESREVATTMNVETTVDPRFSSPDAEPTAWSAAIERLAAARTYWVTTVRPDGRPHATTVAGVWLDGAFHFSTGQSEQKARNLANGNRHVLATIGSSDWDGLDIIIEGEAERVTDAAHLQRFTDAMKDKYDDFFKLRVVDGRLQGGAGATDVPLAFEVRATKAFGFEKGASFGQTRWRFISSGA